jgi:hypothetical protein
MSQSPAIEHPTPGIFNMPSFAPLVPSQAQKNLAANEVETESIQPAQMLVQKPNPVKQNLPPVKPPWSLKELQILMFCITFSVLLFLSCYDSWDFEDHKSEKITKKSSFVKTSEIIIIVVIAL